ncbi:formate dehydrogenase subunit delta [Neorhizobium sp. NPDC001467]|uniref:formate dehydrogenase subunit delta n=1 Tax=Neorhizobium sp. NPDC001467 TaxID=3390595 RepID=UPI003D00FE35
MSDDRHGNEKTPEKLIRMANQIGIFFMSQPKNTQIEGVAQHINRFWAPRMRRQLFNHIENGGDGLLAVVKDASALIRRTGCDDEAPDHSQSPGDTA